MKVMKFIIKKDYLKNIENIMIILAVTVAITTMKMKIVAKMKRKNKNNIKNPTGAADASCYCFKEQ